MPNDSRSASSAMPEGPLTAEQWLEFAQAGLRSLEKLFTDDGWKPDCSLIHGLSIAQGQINEAVQIIRTRSENSFVKCPHCGKEAHDPQAA